MIHAHDVLESFSGEKFSSPHHIVWAIEEKFGANALFHTCSETNLDAAGLVVTLAVKGKLLKTNEGFSLNHNTVCARS